jgi:rubrerythrin
MGKMAQARTKKNGCDERMMKKYPHIESKAKGVWQCPKCKQMWYIKSENPLIFASAQSIFAPISGVKKCPACEHPEHKWKEVNQS